MDLTSKKSKPDNIETRGSILSTDVISKKLYNLLPLSQLNNVNKIHSKNSCHKNCKVGLYKLLHFS